MVTHLPTAFAPAERSSPEEIGQQASLFRRQPQLVELLDYVPVPIMILNQHRQAIYLNQAAVAMIGVDSPTSALGKRPGEAVGCVHAGESEGGCGTSAFCRYCGAVNAILESQRGERASEQCRMCIMRGGVREALDLRVWSNPITIGGQRYTFFVLIDIAAEQRKAAIERVFLHDIMNTVSALHGFVTVMDRGKSDPERDRHFMRRISLLSNRVIEEINAHRQLLAAENDELQVEAKPLAARAVLEELFDAYHDEERLAGRLLRIDDASADVQLETDRALLGRVLGNMVKNAIEASSSGDTVTLGCRTDEGSVCFWVHNSGHMPEHIRLQVFGRSFSTKGAGRGLGTYSMKYLSEKYLHGQVWFTSTEKAGTTFFARYPQKTPPKI